MAKRLKLFTRGTHYSRWWELQMRRGADFSEAKYAAMRLAFFAGWAAATRQAKRAAESEESKHAT